MPAQTLVLSLYPWILRKRVFSATINSKKIKTRIESPNMEIESRKTRQRSQNYHIWFSSIAVSHCYIKQHPHCVLFVTGPYTRGWVKVINVTHSRTRLVSAARFQSLPNKNHADFKDIRPFVRQPWQRYDVRQLADGVTKTLLFLYHYFQP